MPSDLHPSTDAAPAAAPAARPSLRARLSERLPEILIEALFMLAAVVLAFAVEEWREERELDRQAMEARSAILQEVRRNRDELLESRQDTIDAIALTERRLAAAPATTASSESPVIELALLSSAAWHAAQSTEASRRIDYAWLLQVAQTYELQGMVQDAQDAVVEALVAYRSVGDPADAAATRALRARLRMLLSLDRSLEEDYQQLLQ